MRAHLLTSCVVALLIAAGARSASAQFDPNAAFDEAERTKNYQMMKDVSEHYRSIGKIDESRMAYSRAWNLARYWAVYSPTQYSTVSSLGGSGSRRDQGIHAMKALRGSVGPELHNYNFDNELDGLFRELELIENAPAPAVLSGPVLQTGGRYESIGLWRVAIAGGAADQTWFLKQSGTTVYLAGNFRGLGDEVVPQPGSFNGRLLQFTFTEQGVTLDFQFTYSETDDAAHPGCKVSWLRGPMTLRVPGIEPQAVDVQMERIYYMNGGPLAFPGAKIETSGAGGSSGSAASGSAPASTGSASASNDVDVAIGTGSATYGSVTTDVQLQAIPGFEIPSPPPVGVDEGSDSNETEANGEEASKDLPLPEDPNAIPPPPPPVDFPS